MDFYISNSLLAVLLIAAVWEFAWKAIALWRAGRRNQKKWFIALLVINSLGILPIIYLVLSKNDKTK